MFFPSSLERRRCSLQVRSRARAGRCHRHFLQGASLAHWSGLARKQHVKEFHFEISLCEVQKSSCDAAQPSSYRRCGMAVQEWLAHV